MSLSSYFAAVPQASLTFDNANIRLDGENGLSNKDDIESRSSKILKDLLFTVDGGEMVLLLGGPSSSLLDALSGGRSKPYYPENSVKFRKDDFWKYMKSSSQVIYSDEGDVHFPHLTVQQTVDFALSCKYRGSREERERLRNELLHKFGLYEVKDIRVGDSFVRGISGGQRRRVSIIETFIANGSLYLWDNCTKGLDSSTALDFLTILKDLTKTSKSISLVRISQASDEIVSKFDKVLMLSENYQVFFGSVEDCLEHFEDDLGISRGPNDCIIEYLTTILQHSSISDNANDASFSEQRLVQSWIASDGFRYWNSKVKDSGDGKELDLISGEAEQHSQVNKFNQLRFCTKRAFQRTAGDKAFVIAEFLSVIIQSLVIGSLFYNIPLTTIGSFSRGSLTFFSLLFYTFMALADIPNDFRRQGIIKKQVGLNFYHRWIEALASTIFDYVFKLVLVICFTVILYFLAHFQYNASRFFIFLLFLAIYNFSMVSLFSFIGYIAPTVSIANLIAGILLMAIAMYASYVIYLKAMHPWFVWIAYLNPARFAMEAILSNELFNLKLNCTESIVPRGLTYNNITFQHKACAWQGATLGNDYVRGRDYLASGLQYTYNHLWRNFGIILGFLFFYLAISLLAAEYVKPLFTTRNRIALKRFFRFKSSKSDDSGEQKDEILLPSPVASLVSSQSTDSINYSGDITKNQKTIDQVDRTVFKAHETAHVVTWRNIRYSIGEKLLIDNVSGYVSDGLTALMGESGAGKTTLLNILSQRANNGQLEGEILVDGKVISGHDALKRSIGFVQQQDIHLKGLTVRESLEISCSLRGDGDMDYLRTVAEMLSLPLNKFASDLSPTERKLLSIGVELVTKPSVLLLLDEPTSGLDPQAALTIVKFLKELCARGHAVLCTIHQPSKSVFEYFDSIYLLQAGGKCAYFGPTKKACDYFAMKDGHLECSPGRNPADFIIDTVQNSKTNPDDTHATVKKEVDWSAIWSDSKENTIALKQAANLEENALTSVAVPSEPHHKSQPYMKQLLVIIKRQYLCIKRDKSYVASKFLLNGGAGLFIGFSFWKTKHNINGLQNAIFLCFMSLCISSPLINQVQDKALESKEVYLAREAESNTYHWSVLLLAQLLVELPLAVASSTLFFLCCYFCCGYDSSPHIAGLFYLNFILFAAYYLSFGLWLIYSAPDIQTAAVFVAFLYSFTASFCGVMQPYDLFPGFWKFMYRVSPYTYFVDTFVSLLLHDRKVVCETGELVPTSPSGGQNCGQFLKAFVDEFGGSIKNPSSYTVCAYCSYKTGDDFLKQQNMSYSNRWRNFGIQCAFVVFNITAMFVGFYLMYVGDSWSKTSKLVRRLLAHTKHRRSHPKN